MRMFIGIILGCALTIGGAYISDHMTEGPGVRPMVNWEVVSQNVDSLVARLKEGWKKITG